MYVSHAATSNTMLKQSDSNQPSSDQSAPTKYHKNVSVGAAVGISIGVIFAVVLATVVLGTVYWHM